MEPVTRQPGSAWWRCGGTALTILLLALTPLTARAVERVFDHGAWDALLKACVVATDDGGSTQADYRCFGEQRAALRAYLDALAAVAPANFHRWSDAQRLAFLINAYNAWTVELILTRYPALDSIRDLGSVLRSPWKRRFIPLLNATLSLDDIEHGMIRADFAEPRIHFAVNCASIGCPALRAEAYGGERLDAQLEAQTRQFLGDRSRNRLRAGRLEISSLFKWYGDDFRDAGAGRAPRGFLARYGDALGLDAATSAALRSGELPLVFLDYDWRLNDRAAAAP
jgi:hypothetical protein